MNGGTRLFAKIEDEALDIADVVDIGEYRNVAYIEAAHAAFGRVTSADYGKFRAEPQRAEPITLA